MIETSDKLLYNIKLSISALETKRHQRIYYKC